MSTKTPFLSSQISIYNPGRLTDEEIERIFITRKGVFQYLFDLLVAEPPGSIPQHHLVIGERGMGKSTLLHRIAVEFRKQPHREAFLPLTFPEEQYNIDRLSKFWLNCLDALADALDRASEQPTLAELDADIDRWSKQAKNTTAAEMYAHFDGWCKRLNRRVVVLVDNLNLIFNKISREEQHQLRAILMKNGAPILVGASAHSIEDVVDYGAPFYDAFKIQTLKKLSFEEVLETLKNLAEITNNTAFINELYAHRGRLRALYQLTGGTPRTLTMLYPLIREGFSISIQTDLEALMDMATSLYKSRFEELPAQMQVVLDAIAMHWDPAHLEALREITHLENAQLSPQIKRLFDTGWINRLDAYKAKGNAYEISERFFNIWYLMRRSSRRQKKELVCLTKFLATMYGEELTDVANRMLKDGINHPDHAGLHLAMADAVKDKKLAKQLREKSYKALFDFAVDDPDILKNFDIPHEELDKRESDMLRDSESDYYTSLEVAAKYNLIFLYRDKMNRLAHAKLIFENLGPEDRGTVTFYLHSALFAFYDKNLGIASEEFQKALEHTDGDLPSNTQDDWWRFAAVTHKIGYGQEVLNTLEKTGYDIQLRPYYVAIKALGEKDSKAYLNSVAVEVREPAEVIMEKIKRYL